MAIRIVLFLIVVAAAGIGGYYLYYHQEPVCSVSERPMHKVTT